MRAMRAGNADNSPSFEPGLACAVTRADIRQVVPRADCGGRDPLLLQHPQGTGVRGTVSAPNVPMSRGVITPRSPTVWQLDAT